MSLSWRVSTAVVSISVIAPPKASRSAHTICASELHLRV
jgi:hypothetical protein